MDNPQLVQARAIFSELDANGDGKLSPKELHKALADHGYDEGEIESILINADQDGDGKIMFIEFYHGLRFLWEKARDLTTEQESMLAKLSSSAASTPRDRIVKPQELDRDQAKYLAQMHLVHGMTKAELEKHMLKLFKGADQDGNGALCPGEFREVFAQSGLNFSDQEVEHMLERADANHDGRISYQEFVPACFELLAARLTEKMVKMAAHDDPTDMLRTELKARFVELDEKKTGYLTSQQILKAMVSIDTGLATVQLTGLMSRVKPNVYGGVKYADVLDKLANSIYSLCHDMQDGRYFKARETFLNSDKVNIYGLAKGKPAQVLRQVFAAHDKGKTGFISRTQFRSCIASVCAMQAIRLTEEAINALTAAAEFDDDDKLAYPQFLDTAVDILAYLQQETAIWSIADDVKQKSDKMLYHDNRPRRWRHGTYEPRSTPKATPRPATQPGGARKPAAAGSQPKAKSKARPATSQAAARPPRPAKR